MFRAEKIIAALPPVLEPSTLYCVRAGTGFDLYLSDVTGGMAHKVNAIDARSALSVASGAVVSLDQSLLASAGQPARTVQAVGFTNTGKAQFSSLGAGNVVEVYASGADFAAGVVLHREFMGFGEPICFTGLANGAIITSTQGGYGVSEQRAGSQESPMPMLSLGLGFTDTFMFGFRSSGTDDGLIQVVNGPLPSTVNLFDAAGNIAGGQQNIALDPWQHQRLTLVGSGEYRLASTNTVMACTHAGMSNNRFLDSRLVMPLTNDGLTWPRAGFVSAPYPDTGWDYFVQDGASGSAVTSPGAPTDFDSVTGAGDQDYEPPGATRVMANGLISAYSGADSSGGEASPMMAVSAMSQVVAQPFHITDEGDGGNSGVAIASPFEGQARVFSWNPATRGLDLAYTVPLTRGTPATTRAGQNHPAAGLISNDPEATNTLNGTLLPGVIIADVPITVVAQSGSNPTAMVRSQSGTMTQAVACDDDETLMLGHTPSHLAAEIREGADGLLYRRVIGAGGIDSWTLA